MGLIITVAKNFNPPNSFVLDDYIQAGRIGLLKAIRTHDISRGTFSTTAWHNIRWAILGHMKNEPIESVLPITMEPSGEYHEAITDYLPNTLSDREKEVIMLRTEGYTFKAIGEKTGYSKSWAHYIFCSGVKKIRQSNDIGIYD